MADIPNAAWSEAAASNNATPPDGWPEGQLPSTANNSARENMAATKRFWNRSNSVKTTAGTTTAYTLTYSVAATALYDGEEFSFIVNATCGAAPTLNINSLGAKNLRKFTGGAYANCAAGDLLANQPCRVRYNLAAGKFDIVSLAFNPVEVVKAGDNNAFTGNNTFTGATTFTGTAAMSGKAFNEAAWVDVASAATTAIGSAASNNVRITGTTTITGLGTMPAGARRRVRFAGVLILTNTSSLILKTGANIVTAADDTAEFVSLGSNDWLMTEYSRKDGTPLVFYTPPQRAYAYVTVAAGVATMAKQAGFTSVTRNSAGKFTCTMSTAMPDAFYRVLVTTRATSGASEGEWIFEDGAGAARSTTVFHLHSFGDNFFSLDPEAISIEVFA